jgi:hypothetical protein|tara:strand:- start:247 stop:1158 length:912 start_codon:yes stop_codon:yes gene_type:complete
MKEFEEAKKHINYLEKNIQEVNNFKKLHLQYAKKNLYSISYQEHLKVLFAKQDVLSEALEGIMERMRSNIGLKEIDLFIEITEDLIHLMSIGDNSFMNKYYWEEQLINAEKKLQFPDGYKLLFCPWETLANKSIKTAFISLNPGKAPDGADLKVISDERGNSYEVEEFTTASPLTAQFLQLCKFLKIKPSNMLTGPACPFRGNRWKDFTPQQKQEGFRLGNEFWSKALDGIELIIILGDEAKKSINEIVKAELELEIQSGWGNTKLKRFKNVDGVKLIQLPHLSTFKLFSRNKCKFPLKQIFS